jgi:hypothetical protein
MAVEASPRAIMGLAVMHNMAVINTASDSVEARAERNT